MVIPYEHVEAGRVLAFERNGLVIVVANHFLSAVYISLYTAFLPIYTDVFRICETGTTETWSD